MQLLAVLIPMFMAICEDLNQTEGSGLMLNVPYLTKLSLETEAKKI